MNLYWQNRLGWLLVLIVLPLLAEAQTISGAVYNSDSIVAVRNVKVINQRTDVSVMTNRMGTYRLVAQEGDTLLFLHEGYRPQRVVVNMRRRELHEVIFLYKLSVQLTEVEIGADDRVRDSITRRQIYRKELKDADHRPRISNARTTNIGFGVEVDGPLTYGIRKLTGKQKKLEKFKTRMENDERDKYVRSRYTVPLVRNLTSLSNEEAERFILTHPMPYDFATQATDLEIKAWIREQHELSKPKRSSPIRVSQ